MSRTLEEIIALLESDLLSIPRKSEYDEGFAAGVAQALFLLKMVNKSGQIKETEGANNE